MEIATNERKGSGGAWADLVESAAKAATGRGPANGWTTKGFGVRAREDLLAWASGVAADPRTRYEGDGKVSLRTPEDREASLTAWIDKVREETSDLPTEAAREAVGRMFEAALSTAESGEGMSALATLLASEWATSTVSSRYLRETAWRLGYEGDADSLAGVREILEERGQSLDSEEALQMGFLGACAGGRTETAKILMEQGALLNGHCPPKAKAERAGGTALCQALAHGRMETARWLSSLGAEAGPAHAIADWLWHAKGGEAVAGARELKGMSWVMDERELKTVADKAAADIDAKKMEALSILTGGGMVWSAAESRGFWMTAAQSTGKEDVFSGRWSEFAETAMRSGVTPPAKEDVERLDEALTHLGREGSGFVARKKAVEDLEGVRQRVRPETASMEVQRRPQKEKKSFAGR